MPADANWEPIIRSGSNGLSLVVMALSWWIESTDDLDSEIRTAIGNVQWVLSELVETLLEAKSEQSETGSRQSCA